MAPPNVANGNGHHLQRKDFAFPPFSFWLDGNPLTTFDETDPIRGWQAYRASVIAYAAMRFRATKLIEAPLWIAEEKDGQEDWLKGDHPLAELLERPNPDMEMADLLE